MKLFKYSLVLLLILQLTACFYSLKKNSQSNWELGPFYKPKENPIIQADSTKKFFDSIKNDTVKW